jgi:hypothetical protein
VCETTKADRILAVPLKPTRSLRKETFLYIPFGALICVKGSYSNGPETEVAPGDRFQNETLQSLKLEGSHEETGRGGGGGRLAENVRISFFLQLLLLHREILYIFLF